MRKNKHHLFERMGDTGEFAIASGLSRRHHERTKCDDTDFATLVLAVSETNDPVRNPTSTTAVRREWPDTRTLVPFRALHGSGPFQRITQQ